MAAFTYVDAYVAINSVDHSSNVKSVTVDVSLSTEDVTTMGSDWQVLIGGVLSGTLNIEFVDDMTNGDVDDLIWALLIARASTTFEVRPDSASVGANNPKWTGSVLPNSSQVGGAHGAAAMKSVSWPFTGTVARAEA